MSNFKPNKKNPTFPRQELQAAKFNRSPSSWILVLFISIVPLFSAHFGKKFLTLLGNRYSIRVMAATLFIIAGQAHMQSVPHVQQQEFFYKRNMTTKSRQILGKTMEVEQSSLYIQGRQCAPQSKTQKQQIHCKSDALEAVFWQPTGLLCFVFTCFYIKWKMSSLFLSLCISLHTVYFPYSSSTTNRCLIVARPCQRLKDTEAISQQAMQHHTRASPLQTQVPKLDTTNQLSLRSRAPRRVVPDHFS